MYIHARHREQNDGTCITQRAKALASLALAEVDWTLYTLRCPRWESKSVIPAFHCEVKTIEGLRDYPLDHDKFDTLEHIVLDLYLHPAEPYDPGAE